MLPGEVKMKYLRQIHLLLLEQVIICNSILAQKVDLHFSTTQCIEQHKQSKITYSRKVNGIFPDGCTIAVRCQYGTAVCPTEIAGNLTMTLGSKQLDKAIMVINSSECALQVLITNLTEKSFRHGNITCENRHKPEVYINTRTLQVGYPPVRPKNLTVEYLPGSYIHLWLDPVKNDTDTEWVVDYVWREKVRCSNSTAANRTRLRACEIHLKNITKNGFYSLDKGGNVSNNITFTVNVSNKFIKKTVKISVTRSFYLPHFVRPDAAEPELVEAGESWLTISVRLSNVMHNFNHCNLMENGAKDGHLRLEYTVHKVSEAEEHMLRPERNHFRQKFGFYRNLPDDERALDDFNVTSYFPQTKVQNWTCANQTLHVNITGLAPYSHYNITFNLLGRYRGLESNLHVSTKEREPLQSPLYGVSPYSCFSGEHDRVSCVIYFEEIPRILRRAGVANYILEGYGLADGHQIISQECGNFTQKADGQSNSILVENLVHGCVYNISLTAEPNMTKNCLSATQILNASDIGKGVEVEVVVDILNESYSSYKMFWNNASWAQTGGVRYYIHYCYTRTESTQRYICMNNRATQEENSTWSSSTMVVRNYNNNIKPTFFISAVQNGKTSGMIKEKWRYCVHGAPEKVKSLAVRSIPVDSTQLEVTFERADTDTSDCKGGRPAYFVISWKECSNGCKQYQDSNNFLTVNAYHKGPFTLNGLTESTDYCVWVKTVGSDNGNFSLTCKVGMTAKSNTEVIIVAVMLVGVTVFSLGCVLTYCYWRRSKAKIEAIHVVWPKPNTKRSLLHERPGSAFPFFTKVPARPRHVLSGDSGIEDGGADAMYMRSMLTESGDNKPCCTQATTVNNRALPYSKELSWCSESVSGSHLHMEQEDNQSRSILRYQLVGLQPADSSAVCDDNEETEDSEEEEELSDSELSSEFNNSSQHNLSDGSFTTYPLSYSGNILSRLPEALFQPSGQV